MYIYVYVYIYIYIYGGGLCWPARAPAAPWAPSRTDR